MVSYTNAASNITYWYECATEFWTDGFAEREEQYGGLLEEFGHRYVRTVVIVDRIRRVVHVTRVFTDITIGADRRQLYQFFERLTQNPLTLTLGRPLLTYVYSYKASCARPG